MIFLPGKPPGLFHQREGSPRCRAAGFHEPLAANPGPHGSAYPGMGEPINCSPQPVCRAWLSSPPQPRRPGWDNLPGAGSGPPPGHGCQAQPVCGHHPAGLRGRCPRPWSQQLALLLPSALQGHAQSPCSIPGAAEGQRGMRVLGSYLSHSQIQKQVPAEGQGAWSGAGCLSPWLAGTSKGSAPLSVSPSWADPGCPICSHVPSRLPPVIFCISPSILSPRRLAPLQLVSCFPSALFLAPQPHLLQLQPGSHAEGPRGRSLIRARPNKNLLCHAEPIQRS